MMQRVIYEAYGSPDALKIQQTEIPEPSDDEVLVKVMAAGVNPVDFKLRNGSMRFISPAKFPRVPGGEIAGIVEKAGKNAGKFKAGEKVFAMLPMAGGGYSSYLAVKENLLAQMPDNMSFRQGAAIPLAGLTALQCLRDKAGIKAGDEVLINGGSGGVGMFAILIAKACGASVTAVCSGRNLEFVKELGAHNTINYQTEKFTESTAKFDIVFDAVAKSNYSSAKKILTPAGIFVSTVPSPSLMFRQMINPLTRKKAFGILTRPGGKDLAYLATLFSQGKLTPNIEKVYTLENANLAHEHIESERVRGKIVIVMPHSQ